MELLHQCPICKSEQIVPFSMKYQSGFPHISRTQCKQCQLQFANPMANEKELMDFYSNYYSKGNFGALDYKKKIKEKINQIKANSIRKN
jgi:transcription elongation factor Elf1